MESTLRNMVTVLLATTLAASGAVGGAYLLTKDLIEQAESRKKTEAVEAVLPPFSSLDAPYKVPGTGADSLTVTVARNGADVAGYAVESYSEKGYSGMIRLTVGFDAAYNICKVQVTAQNETPGLGAKIADQESHFTVQFEGKNPENFKLLVRKDGGDVDAITASTITSRAYTEAIRSAYEAITRKAEAGPANRAETLKSILPPFDKLDAPNERIGAAGDTVRIIVARQEGAVTGYAVESSASQAPYGTLLLLTGFDREGVIRKVVAPAPRKGMIVDPQAPFVTQFEGKNPADYWLALKSDGGDVDAVSGSTLTSRAYTEAVRKAWEAVMNLKKQSGHEQHE